MTPNASPANDEPTSVVTWEERGYRLLHVVGRLCLWILLGLAVVGVLDLLGFDAVGWVKRVWDNIRNVSPWSIALALVFVTIGKLLSSVPWTVALRASYPDEDIPYKVILAANQAGSLINTFAPAKAGSVAKLGIMRVAIPGSSLGTIVSVSALTSVVFGVISAVTFIILVLYQRPVISEEADREGTITKYVQDHPGITVAVIVGIVLIAIFLFRRYRSKLDKLKDQFLLGGAVLKTPGRFVLLVMLPSVLSYMTRYIQTAIFMHAFDIPVTIQSLFLVIAGRQFSGLIAVTPGGIGTKQAVDVVALRNYAPSDVVTSFSLAQDAVTKAWNILFGIIAMSWGFGVSGARDIWTNRDEYISAGQTSSDTDAKGIGASEPTVPRDDVVTPESGTR